MFVVFEGIDGSGKTTLSTRVAKRLRKEGLTVEHVREGGAFASTVTESIRALGRDSRNLALSPDAELMIYTAREVQLLDEATGPALARANVVIADRYFYSAEVLATHGRGLPAARVHEFVSNAMTVTPDLVLLVDVDPQIGRARRRISKIRTPDDKAPSRKGLAGAGLQTRLRRGYQELAAREPERWIVLDNSDADLEEQTEHVVSLVRTALRENPAAAIAHARRGASADARIGTTAPATPAEALAAFLEWIDSRARREPDLAAYLLAGLAGPAVDDRRVLLAERAPEVIAAGLGGLGDSVSWSLRHKLAVKVPSHIARSLARLVGQSADALRADLIAAAPDAVARSLVGRSDFTATEMRSRLFDAAPEAVMLSLARLDTPEASSLRLRWQALRGRERAFSDPRLAAVAAGSVLGIESDSAWETRDAAFAAAPVAALESLESLLSDRAWEWRRRHIDRAQKSIAKSLDGLDVPAAWEMRERLAPVCKEAVDSMFGRDGEIAWRIREACAGIWPSTVAKSLGPLAIQTRGAALLERLLRANPGNISLWKHVSSLAAPDGAVVRATVGTV